MKIAVNTWYHYRNYGTALQAAALCEKLRLLGHDAGMIQYIPVGYVRTIPDYSLQKIASRVVRRLAGTGSDSPSGSHFCSDEKEKKFDDFLHSHISFTGECRTLSDLENLNSSYDAFLCGSDQIWSPLNFNPHYFLDFVHDEYKMVAYAPSMGTDRVEDRYIREQMPELIRRFHHLSVRETEGQELIRKLTGKKAECVLDPTLLLSVREWAELVPPQPVEGSYLLVYFLGQSADHWDLLYKLATQLHLSIKIIPVYDLDLERDGCIRESVGPEEFVNLFRNASYVCTDSFHGAVFSILFHRQFTLLERFKKQDANNQNSRIYTLMNCLSLNGRLLTASSGIVSQVEERIDFENVDGKLSALVKKSVDYLISALGEVEEHLRETTKVNSRSVTHLNSLCCGCGACAEACPQNAVSIQMNKDGFLHAVVNESACIDCGKCARVCPFIGEIAAAMPADGKLYSYKDHDDSVLGTSTSGGFAFRLSSLLLERGYAVVGCAFDREEQRAKHILVTQKSELSKLQGSKYIQSDFSAVHSVVKSCSKPIVFLGTPCQIAAARRLYKNRTDYIYIDLVCHGVPSDHLYRKYRQLLSERYGLSDDQETIFRYQPKGWRSIHLYTSDGERDCCLSSRDDPFFRMFDVGNCYNEACYECRWRDRTEADIRIGDYWGPKFESDHTGVSMVLCATETGERLLDMLNLTGGGDVKRQPTEDYLNYQQQKNLPKPTFYSTLLKELKRSTSNLEDLVERYAVPLENRELTKRERILHFLKCIR